MKAWEIFYYLDTAKGSDFFSTSHVIVMRAMLSFQPVSSHFILSLSANQAKLLVNCWMACGETGSDL